MNTFRVEYLITVDQKEPFCSSVSSFNNFLRSIDGITVNNNLIEYKKLSIQYEIQMGEMAADKQRYFHIKLTCDNSKHINEFEELLKSIRTLLFKASSRNIQILWDDIGFFYARQGYPMIYEIENTLRKLITKFMLTSVGLSWTNESVPQEVAESIRTKGQKGSHNYLYEIDFIQLSNFLFKEYTAVNSKTFTDNIRGAKKLEDLNLDELRAIIPKSNWERYFSSLVNCESDYLRVRWEKLYDRRNQIAHNKSINKTDFDEIKQLINEIKPKLQEAISKLDQVVISDEDREAVAENAAANTNALYGEFLGIYKVLTENLYQLASSLLGNDKNIYDITKNRYSPRSIIRASGKVLPISNDLKHQISELSDFRNIIVHKSQVNYSDEEIMSYITLAQKIHREVITISERSIQANTANGTLTPMTENKTETVTSDLPQK